MVFNEKSDGNIDIEFPESTFPNPESEVVEDEGNRNAFFEKEVTPPENKRKVEP